jgi:uncharacterized protein YggE
MFKNLRRYTVTAVLVIAMLAIALPAMAQDNNSTDSTITVVGTGTAYAAPDTATVELGVESRNASIRDAFTEANSTIDTIITQLVELGIAREDISTTGLNIHRDYYGMESGDGGYVVSNVVRVNVRDVTLIAEVINSAVEGGANQLYGLNFSVSNATDLNSTARSDAMADARARAEELAQLAGLTLGSVTKIVEHNNYYGVTRMGRGAADGAFEQSAIIEPGLSTISLSLEVTFSAR